MIGISAQISLYPLGQPDIAMPIEDAIASLKASGVETRVGNMSTQIWGGSEQVFDALRAAFAQAAATGPAVMVVTVSNACPLPPSPDATPAEDGTRHD